MFMNGRKWWGGINDSPLSSPTIMWIVSACEENPDRKKNCPTPYFLKNVFSMPDKSELVCFLKTCPRYILISYMNPSLYMNPSTDTCELLIWIPSYTWISSQIRMKSLYQSLPKYESLHWHISPPYMNPSLYINPSIDTFGLLIWIPSCIWNPP